MPDRQKCKNELLLTTLLKDVSRSFYLTLRVLPPSSRTPISIAYLLARAADSIADTTLIFCHKRSEYLVTLGYLLTHNKPGLLKPIVEGLTNKTSSQAEHTLISRLEDIYALYHTCHAQDKQMITQVVSTLISGMAFDLDYFPPEESGQLGALTSAADLDRYTYMVAGCVGEFWTDICYTHETSCRHWHVDIQKERGIRLGKALQLTNILRDTAQDLRIGRCYLPEKEMYNLNIKPSDLLEAQNASQSKPLLDHWIRVALSHYHAGLDYALSIPRHALRLRLAVFWPMLIGLNTLRLLASSPNWLSAEVTIKVPRHNIYKIILASLPLAASNQLMTQWINRLHDDVENQLVSTQAVTP